MFLNTPFLNAPVLTRRADVAEKMDDPHCDKQSLERTYGQFRFVNALLGGWRRVYRREVRPRARRRPVRVLDIGCGGGDVARALMRWAGRDGLSLEVVGIDPDERAIEWAGRQERMPGLAFRAAHSRALVDAGQRFDVVLSHHVVHHLDDDDVRTLLSDSLRLCAPGGVVLHRDIARGRAAYIAFAGITALLPATYPPRSFIREDGLTSIRRAYSASELRALAPAEWSVRRSFPARLDLRTHS